MLPSGATSTIHQSVSNENGLEVWRRLAKRYNPLTPMTGLQLMMKVMVPGTVKKGVDVQNMINEWEGVDPHRGDRAYDDKISGMARIGVLIRIVPDDLQDVLLQPADRLK